MELQCVRRPEGPQDWEAQRAVITNLYIAKDVELDDLMKIMEDEHFFKATKKQYKTHFTKWDLRKNIRSSEYNAIIKRRRKREEEGKGSAFRLRGALVDDSKIVRYEKKTKTGDGHEIAEAGTPEDLSCFTPSPVVGSPVVPSPDFWHVRSPNLLRTAFVSPSEQGLFAPNAASPDLPHSQSPYLLHSAGFSTSQKACLAPNHRLFFPEFPNDEVDLTFFEFVMILVDRLASWKSVKLEIIPTNPRESRYFIGVQNMGDVSRFRVYYPTGPPSEALLSDFMSLVLNPSPPRLGSCFVEYLVKRTMSTRIILRSTSMYFVLKKLYEIGFISDLIAQVKATSIELRTQNFFDSLRISDITTSSDVPGNASGCELSVPRLGCEIIIKFSSSIGLDLEQEQNPELRRRESFDSVRSLESFQSDSVVDWKELLYGYNQ